MKNFYIVVSVSMLIIFYGFISHSSPNTMVLKKSFPLGKADHIKTEISFTSGKITIGSCSSNILSEGIYKFSKKEWKPTVSYSENNGSGYLKIATTDERENKNYTDSDTCNWNIRLNKNVKNDLSLTCFAGDINADLHDFNLERMKFRMTAGKAEINLRNTSVPNFDFKALAGQADIDLSGKWKNDLNANIVGGVGELNLKLPAQIGVQLNMVGILGDKSNLSGLIKKNNTYTNHLYGKTKETLYIDITGGIGDVNIEWVN